jgi:hypothetical protein
LLLDKVRELNLRIDDTPGEGLKATTRGRLRRLRLDDRQDVKRFGNALKVGIVALSAHLAEQYPDAAADYAQFRRLRKLAAACFISPDDLDGPDDHQPDAAVPITVAQLRQALRDAEQALVERATRTVAELREEHRTLSLRWAKAPTEQVAQVLKDETERLEEKARKWERWITPLSQQIRDLHQEHAQRRQERTRLVKGYKRLPLLERGEALRRIFQGVVLHWDREDCPPPRKRKRGRKTRQKARSRYVLQFDRIEWRLAPDCGLCKSS